MRIVINAWRELANELAGGAEILVDHLAQGMLDRGHETHLVVGGPVGLREYNVASAGGVYGHYLRAPLVRRRVAPRADLVVDTAAGMTYCSPLLRRAPTILLVHHLHTEQWAQWFSRPVAAMGRRFESDFVPMVYRRCLVVAVSESTADGLERIGIDRSRIRIVRNVADPPPPGPPIERSTEPLFFALGRMVPHKRMRTLVDIWAQVQPIVGGRFVIGGDGPERKSVEALNIPGLEVLGRVDDETKHRLFDQAWFLVHGASHEGWGVVITEAASHGTPCLAFDVPGVRDAVVNESTGVLAADSDQFIKYWIDLAGDRAKMERYGRAARLRSAEFSATATLDSFEQVALEAIDRSPKR